MRTLSIAFGNHWVLPRLRWKRSEPATGRGRYLQQGSGYGPLQSGLEGQCRCDLPYRRHCSQGTDRLSRAARLRLRSIPTALNARTYQAGQRYWSLHVAQERKKLERRGFTPSQIDAEISRYATAISRILHSQKQYGSTP
ncbi:DUF6074 family protein, partial [Mesorhizobium sp. M0701]|uniref:DUF6074 family protein n=1 Tax=Mesorhizobium sp. M0701 TaxID=2956989 RepID=UPI00333B5036